MPEDMGSQPGERPPPEAAEAAAPITYILIGTGASGVRTYHAVKAASVDDAMRELESRGYRDVEAYSDDSERSLRAATADRERTIEQLGADDLVAITERHPLANFAWFAFGLMIKFWWATVPALAVFVGRRVLGMPWSWWDAAAAVVLAGPGAFVWWDTWGSRTHREVQRAVIAADWKRVLALTPKLRRAMEYNSLGAAEYRSNCYAARALAATGRLDEGLDLLERSRGGIKDGEHRQSLAAVYEAAGQFEQALKECLLAAAEPDAGYMPWLRAAELCAMRLGRPQEARAAMQEVYTHPIGLRRMALVGLVEGVVLVGERRNAEAIEMLEGVLPEFERRAAKDPIVQGCAAGCRLHLAVALSRVGDRARAGAELTRAEPLFRRQKDDALLAWAQREVGMPARPGR